MKKLVITLLLAATLSVPSLPAFSAGSYIVRQNTLCGFWFYGPCPSYEMYNRTGKKVIGRFQPNALNYCSNASMRLWIIGAEKNGVGFTKEDREDRNAAIKALGSAWRWGCCFSSDPTGTICLN